MNMDEFVIELVDLIRNAQEMEAYQDSCVQRIESMRPCNSSLEIVVDGERYRVSLEYLGEDFEERAPIDGGFGQDSMLGAMPD